LDFRRIYLMICPGTETDCDNPGCRRGGCQGRLPPLPLFRAQPLIHVVTINGAEQPVKPHRRIHAADEPLAA
jgi:hypothetical protein